MEAELALGDPRMPLIGLFELFGQRLPDGFDDVERAGGYDGGFVLGGVVEGLLQGFVAGVVVLDLVEECAGVVGEVLGGQGAGGFGGEGFCTVVLSAVEQFAQDAGDVFVA